MPYKRNLSVEPWLASPLSTPVGELELAGTLANCEGIDPAAMRVLGSYAIIYIVVADGYYADANGVRQRPEELRLEHLKLIGSCVHHSPPAVLAHRSFPEYD